MLLVFLDPALVVLLELLELAVDGFLVLPRRLTPDIGALTLGGGTELLFVLPARSASVSRGAGAPLMVPAAVLAISRFLLLSLAVSGSAVCLLPIVDFASMLPGFTSLLCAIGCG